MRVLRQEDVNAGWGEPEAAGPAPGVGFGGADIPAPPSSTHPPGVVINPPKNRAFRKSLWVPYQ